MPDNQSAVIAFLQSSAAHPGVGPVETIKTHGALVFLDSDTALKMKRAVRYDYMDLSTLALREQMLRRELALNQPVAPKIYHDVVPVTQDAEGRLAVDGQGKVVEWVLRMWRFPLKDELLVIAQSGGLTDALAQDLGHSIFAYHTVAGKRDADGRLLILGILEELDRVFDGMKPELGAQAVADFNTQARAGLEKVSVLLTARSADGHVRRCHGDLHLRNIVLIDGKPVPFDALEFDEQLGTCDVLYDLAFLIMDLQYRDLQAAANIVLNTYLLAAGGGEDAGLAALPLFVAVRAAIRAMVCVQTSGTPGKPDPEARAYLAEALGALRPSTPRLVAVGGLSGSGKTTLARRLAPGIGAAPGAVHLRSDLERKAMIGVKAQTRLSADHYSAAGRDQVYRHMLDRTSAILRAGHSVLLDATFIKPEKRTEAEAVAAALDIPFAGVWLEAPEATLVSRVNARVGNASDADEAVLRSQLEQDAGRNTWHRVPTEGSLDAALAKARAVLAGQIAASAQA